MNRSFDAVMSGDVGFEGSHARVRYSEAHGMESLGRYIHGTLWGRDIFWETRRGETRCAREAPRAFLDQREILFLDVRKNCSCRGLLRFKTSLQGISQSK
jgi:hypothetical protein